MNRKRIRSNAYLLFLLAWLLLFAGCSNGESKRTEDMSMMPNGAVTQEFALDEKTKQATTEPPPETPSVAANRKLIKNVEIRLETTTFHTSVEKLEASVEQFGGYVEGSSVTGTSVQERGSSMRSASYTIRIPASKLDEYLKKAGSIGNIVVKQVGTEDVTEQYIDTEARVKALKAREERLLELLKQAGALKDVIEIEKELSAVRYEIEGFTTTLQRYDSLVAYSTVRVELIEVQSLTPNASTLGERIGETFKGSVAGIVNGAQSLLIFVIGNSPVLLLLGAVGAGVVIIIRRVRKGKNRDL